MEFGFKLTRDLNVALLDGTTSNTEPVSNHQCFLS